MPNPPGRPDLNTQEWKRTRAAVTKGATACHYCGGPGPFEVDHVRPASRGGTDDPGNLVAACRACNRSKRDRTVEEWRAPARPTSVYSRRRHRSRPVLTVDRDARPGFYQFPVHLHRGRVIVGCQNLGRWDDESTCPPDCDFDG